MKLKARMLSRVASIGIHLAVLVANRKIPANMISRAEVSPRDPASKPRKVSLNVVVTGLAALNWPRTVAPVRIAPSTLQCRKPPGKSKGSQGLTHSTVICWGNET